MEDNTVNEQREFSTIASELTRKQKQLERMAQSMTKMQSEVNTLKHELKEAIEQL